MAFGFSPKHTETFTLDELTPGHFLAIAHEAAKTLGWNVSYASVNGLIVYTGMSFTSWGEEIKIKIENGTANVKSECTGSQIFDWGRNKENVEKFLNTFNDIKSTLSNDELQARFAEVESTLAPKEHDILNQPPPTASERITNVFALFKPVEGYFVTPLLINVNIVVFILMIATGANVFLPDNESLLRWGANFKPLTLAGQPWRLLTSCFVHIGVLHLLMNMYALVYIGMMLEPRLGKLRFTAAYFLTGIVASTASLWWHDLTVSAGASGAIFGMYGVFLAMLTTNLIEKSARKAFLTSIGIFVVYNLMNGLKDGIDNAAHIGGLVSGIIVGYVFYPSLTKNESNSIKLATIGFLTFLVIGAAFAAYRTLPNDIGVYEKRMESFSAMEQSALEVFNMPPNTPKDEMLKEINNRGIYYWNENIKLLNGMGDLDLPFEIRYQNQRLLRYCELRIKSYNLIYKAIAEDSDKYEDSIRSYNHQIDSIVSAMQ